jgi:hypothetical protein
MNSSVTSEGFTPLFSASDSSPTVVPPSIAEGLRKRLEAYLEKENETIEERRKYVTTLLNPDGTVVEEETMAEMIKKGVQKIKTSNSKYKRIFSLDSITVSTGEFTFGGHKVATMARRIELKRKWCLYDLIPFGVLLPTLFSSKSVYRKGIVGNSISNVILQAKPVKTKIEELIEFTKDEISRQDVNNMLKKDFQEDLEECAAIIISKYNRDQLDFIIDPDDKRGKSPAFVSRLTKFTAAFKARYDSNLNKGIENLRIAFWQDRNVIIYIPIDSDGKIPDRQTAYLETQFNIGLTALVIKVSGLFLDEEEV